MALLDRVLANVSPAAALRRGVQLSEQGDVKQAFPLLVRAARAGIAEAEFRLGRCYMEGAGVPMFNDVEEMAEAAGLLARYPNLRNAAQCDSLPTTFFQDRRRI